MSVDSAENSNVSSGWGQNTSTSYDNIGTNQWLVNNGESKVCGSWAQAVSGDTCTSSSSTTNSNIPNNQTNKLNSSNQSDLIDENGSQTNQNLLVSSHFNFDNLNHTKWGKSVINHDNNAWDLVDLSPSSANHAENSNSAGNSATGFKSALDQQIRNNNGTGMYGLVHIFEFKFKLLIILRAPHFNTSFIH